MQGGNYKSHSKRKKVSSQREMGPGCREKEVNGGGKKYGRESIATIREKGSHCILRESKGKIHATSRKLRPIKTAKRTAQHTLRKKKTRRQKKGRVPWRKERPTKSLRCRQRLPCPLVGGKKRHFAQKGGGTKPAEKKKGRATWTVNFV